MVNVAQIFKRLIERSRNCGLIKAFFHFSLLDHIMHILGLILSHRCLNHGRKSFISFGKRAVSSIFFAIADFGLLIRVFVLFTVSTNLIFVLLKCGTLTALDFLDYNFIVASMPVDPL